MFPQKQLQINRSSEPNKWSAIFHLLLVKYYHVDYVKDTQSKVLIFTKVCHLLYQDKKFHNLTFFLDESQIEIKLIIPWRFYVHIEYIITSAWPPAYN